MRSTFSLFRSHLDVAHQYWQRLLTVGDVVIDATCGNGHDTQALAELVLGDKQGHVLALDLQKQAIENTCERLKENLSPEIFSRITFQVSCHSQLPSSSDLPNVKCVVYNLGYLPGGDKSLTTESSTSLESIRLALDLVCKGGAVSIMCYPGHPEGEVEAQKILAFVRKLPSREWNVCYHEWVNRPKSPSLLFLQKQIEA